MEIYTIDPTLIARGQACFQECVSQSFGGKSPAYRQGGVGMVPGAIVSAIKLGFETEDEIARIVARATRCWDTTVATVLTTLADPRVADRLWTCCDGIYELAGQSGSKPFTIITQ